MARRRKSHKRKSYRRKRHSAMSGIGSGITGVASMVAGAVIGRILQNKLSSKVNPKYLAIGQIAVGTLLPKFVKNKFVSGIGTGMVVNGGVTALNSFGVISGVAGMSDYEVDYMSGTDELSSIAGDDDMFDGSMGVIDEGTMSGTDELSSIAGDEDYDF
jgi:hypothetical protein